MTPLLQHLKERQLVQWALAYLAGAWALVEATTLVVGQFHWPEVVGQAVTVVAFFGFFVTLVLAWYHGEKGRQRVSGPELLIIALLLVVAGAAVTWVRNPSDGPGSPPPLAGEGTPADPLAIAVLPVTNMAGSEDEFLAEGLHEDLIAQLSMVGAFTRVISRTTAMRYRDTHLSVTEIGRELGVGSVVEASVRRAGGRILVVAQLIDATNDNHIWAERYDDRSERDIFDIQADITRRIAQALRATLTPRAAERIARLPTDNWQAYQLYLEARHYFHQRGEEPLRRSIELFKAAIAEDPGFAEAYAGLAAAFFVLPGYTSPREVDALLLADSVAQKAISLRPDLAEPHSVRGKIFTVRWMWAAGAAEHRIALGLEPQNPNVLLWSATDEAAVGRFDAAIERLQKAHELDPASTPVIDWLGRIHRLRGDHEEYLHFARQEFELGRTNGWRVCDALLWLRRLDEAETICARGWAEEDRPIMRSLIEGLRSPSGHALAVESVSRMERGSTRQMRHWQLMGETDSLFSVLAPWRTEREYGEIDDWFEWVWGVSGTADRGHPRFRNLMRSLGLVGYWRESDWPDMCSPVGGDDFECH
jgi:TolB-like protein